MRYVRAYHKPGVMNRTEHAYSLYLDQLKKVGDIEAWSYEPETLKLGKDCRYTPDFRVIKVIQQEVGELEDGSMYYVSQPIIEFHEVKGTVRRNRTTQNSTKPFIEDDALVKIKAAAEMHPYKFIIVWKGRDGWEKREIN